MPPRLPVVFSHSAKALAAALCLLAAVACHPERDEIKDSAKPEVAPIVLSNALGGSGSAVYHEFADAPIHWQPWGPLALRKAKQSKRLIFCVLARAQDPGFFGLMGELHANESVVEAVNRHYIPVLVDLDDAREFEVMTQMLAVELRQPVAFPVLIWMDWNGRPLATTQLPVHTGAVAGLFGQSHEIIQSQWQKDLLDWKADPSDGDVMVNSRLDHQRRLKRLISASERQKFTDDSPGAVAKALASLMPMYDEFSHQFSSAGAVLPSNIISCFARAAMCQNLDHGLRDRSKEVIESIVPHLLQSPMLDPLDGGCFSYREGASWQLPAFTKNCVSQIEFATALLLAHQAAEVPGARDGALGLIASIERNCRTSEGLFGLAPTTDSDPVKWTWTTGEVTEILGQQEASWWFEMTQMKDLGNLDGELASTGGLFRRNTPAIKKSPSEMARLLGISAGRFEERFNRACGLLLEVRYKRLEAARKDFPPDLFSSFSMVSLYVLAYQVTNDGKWRDRAIELHRKCRNHFVVDGELLPLGGAHEVAYTRARARDHAVALLACLDLAGIARDEVDFETIMDEHCNRLTSAHINNGELLECDPAFNFIELPLESRRMIFGVSTQGMLLSADVRSTELGWGMPETLRSFVRKLPVTAQTHPMVHTDLLKAVFER